MSESDSPELFLSTADTRRLVNAAVKAGKIRRIASRLYTTNLTDPPEQLVRRRLWHIVALYFPGALIADRTAIEYKPSTDGSVFIVAQKGVDLELPGITIRPRRGHPPLDSDKEFIGGLHLSSFPRAILENLKKSRTRRGRVSRTLAAAELEMQLDQVLRTDGADALNRLREEARSIALQLDLAEEFELFDRMAGGLLGTRSHKMQSRVGNARVKGAPFDPRRLTLFEKLADALARTAPVLRPAPLLNQKGNETLAFFESYFSNFIEGTEFEVDEASDIVFGGVIPARRPADAHDILGTFEVVSSNEEMSRRAGNIQEFLNLLCERHSKIMGHRPETNPGHFKVIGNRAGSTVFVAPDLVVGTISVGFEMVKSMLDPFHRAVFMMFLVSEVHPFNDGNGRTARIMMNSELVAAGEQRILIPTIYRNNYIAALKAMSNNSRPDALIRVLDFAQRFTAAVPWTDVPASRSVLEYTHAFMDSTEAENNGVRLTLPIVSE